MQIFSIRRGNSLAIDLGNSNTILSKIDSFYSHPSLVVLNQKDNSLKAVGKDAADMFGRVQDNLKVVRPLKEGLIADFHSAKEMLKALVAISYPKGSILSGFDHIIASVPFASTEVERRALRGSLEQFNSSRTFLVYEPLAAAVGLGLDIGEADGKFVIDIGGGITEAAVISLSGIVNHSVTKVAGDSFDEAIQKHIRDKHNVDIGIHMAEQVKIRVGAATNLTEDFPDPFSVVGKDSKDGIPRGIDITHSEVAEALDSSLTRIEQLIIETLEQCPPELAGDIYANGIHLTGGGSLLRGLGDRIASKIKIPVHPDPEALYSVSRGMIAVLKDPTTFRPILFK